MIRTMHFAAYSDARDYLSAQGYRRHSERTFFGRNGKTARVNRAGKGSVSLTIF